MIRAKEGWMSGLLLAFSLTWSVPGAVAAPRAEVRGTATYRERIALPPGATFEATLEDVSRSDAPGEIIGRTRTRIDQVPVDFAIRYDARRLRPRASFAVRATISERGRTLFTGWTSYRVNWRGRGNDVDVLMRRVRDRENPPPPPGGGPAAGLLDSRWRAVEIGGRVVNVPERAREPWLELDSRAQRATGSGGCNRFSGTFEVGRTRLTFGPLMSTKMACVSMETENAFFRALERTRGYRVRGRVLELTDDMGRVAARLEEGNLR